MAIENVTKGTWVSLQQLLRKESNQLVVQGKAAFVATLTLLSELASVVHDESTASKVVLHSAISVWIEPTLALLSMDVLFKSDHEVTEAIFNFYLSVFKKKEKRKRKRSITLIALSEVRRQRPPTICHSHYLCFATILYF